MAIECTKMSWQDIPVLLIRTKNVLAGHFRSNGSCMTIECTKNVLAGHSCSAYSYQKCPGRTFLCFRFSLLVLEETTVSSCILQAISPVSKRPVFREQSCVEDALPSRSST